MIGMVKVPLRIVAGHAGRDQLLQRAMAKQAEAERERCAQVIHAQGELQASEALAQAARTLSHDPAAIQLRFLQTVTEIAAENNSTTLFPIDIFRPFLEKAAAIANTPAQQNASPMLSAGEQPAAAPTNTKEEVPVR